MPRFLPAVTLLWLSCACSSAAAAGFNMSWDDCGTHGSALKTSACDTDAGYHDLVVSAVLDAPMPQFVGAEVTVRLHTGAQIPDWWRIDAGHCRAGLSELVLDFDAVPSSCGNPYGPGPLGGLQWDMPPWGDGMRLRAIAAILQPKAIDAGVEYTLFRVRTYNTSTSSCSGCGTPACIAVEQMRLYQPAGVGDVFVYMPDWRGDVGWQCPSLGYIVHTPYICLIDPGCATSTKSPTWGSIKALYR